MTPRPPHVPKTVPVTPAPAKTSTTTASEPEWQVVTATARGRSHIAHGLSNEDAVAHAALAGSDGIVVAVADGHGHERHFRSKTGSALAVRVACEAADALLAELAADPPPAAAADTWPFLIRDGLPPAIVRSWRDEVGRDIEANPYSELELTSLEQEGDGPEIPYGATLLVAVITGGWLISAQIGDGDLVAVHPDGEFSCPVPGDDRLDGLRTTSLCQPDPLDAFRTGARDLTAEPLAALLLATDGYGNAQASDPWQPAWARDMAGLAAERGAGWFAKQLPVWAELCASGEGSGDDTTIALLLGPASARNEEGGTWTG
jgi:hypothetical protein